MSAFEHFFKGNLPYSAKSKRFADLAISPDKTEHLGQAFFAGAWKIIATAFSFYLG